MWTPCWKNHRAPVAALFSLIVLCAGSARAELMSDATQFLKDYDRLAVLQTEIAADRDTMSADLDEGKLKNDVKRFFADRLEAYAVRLLKAADRKEMKITLSFHGQAIAKPTASSGDLTADATSYISSFDAWTTFRAQNVVNVDAIRSAVNASDSAALTTACTTFYNTHRSTLEKRLQWQSDIKGLKKDVTFKGTGKAHAPDGATLKEHVAEFIADRSAWETLAATVDADRNNLRAALSAPDSLSATVMTFLTDRRAHRVKGNELTLDRKAMLKDVGPRVGSKNELKPDTAASVRDLDSDEPDDALEGSADGAGEK